jgi:hypothetical protein
MTKIIRDLFAMRKRLKDDDLRKLDKIIKDEMVHRDTHRETQSERSKNVQK